MKGCCYGEQNLQLHSVGLLLSSPPSIDQHRFHRHHFSLGHLCLKIQEMYGILLNLQPL